MRYIAVFLTILAALQETKAQTATDSVKQTVNNLFTAMRTSDTVLLRSAFSNEAILQTITNAVGQTKVRTDKVDAFVQSVGRPHTEVYDERIVFERVDVDGDLASVWTPYKFYIGTNFSHCGVNSFQLVRLNGEWKIQYLIDTRRKEPCR